MTTYYSFGKLREAIENITSDCPRCGVKNSHIYRESELFITPPFKGEIKFNQLDDDDMLSQFEPHELWGIYRCNSTSCKANLTVVFTIRQTSPRNISLDLSGFRIYPYIRSHIPGLKNTPPNIVDCYKEAVNCFDLGLLKGALLVARTTLNLIALDKGYPKKKINDNLFKKIEFLKSHVLQSSSLKKMAHVIRRFGNDMGHPENWFKRLNPKTMKPSSEYIDKNDVKQLLGFLHEIIDEIYEEPQRIKVLTSKPVSK